jgi:SAM-dependent methyltransferase
MRSESLQENGGMCCPVCLATTRRLFRTRGYWITGCPECHHRCAEVVPSTDHVERVYGSQYFHGGGAGYSDYLSEAAILRAHGRRYAQLLTRYRTPGIMLDVGAAAGFILRGLQDAGWQGRGIEPNPCMAAYAREQLGLQMEAGTFETFHSDALYDLVTMIQVVAHFQEPRRAFHTASDILKPDGLLLIETWNRESWTARIFGTHWHEYSPPSVLHWFSPTGLQHLAVQFGFHEIGRGRPRKWLNAAHAKSLLRSQDTGSWVGRLAARIVRVLPDSLPIPYPAEDLFWTLFQKV